MTRLDIRIATVYKRDSLERSQIQAMDTIRWLRVSEGLADLGFSVDMIVDAPAALGVPRPNLRYVPLSAVDWSLYQVVKTLYPTGLRVLLDSGGAEHPFIIARVGSVVGPTDDTPGVFFVGEERRALWELHQVVNERARYVSLVTEPSRVLWQTHFGRPPVLVVPTGVDRIVPSPRWNPFARSSGKHAVHVGNIYGGASGS